MSGNPTFSPPKLFGKLGLAELLYLSIIAILTLSMAIYFITGMGSPPPVEIEAYAEDSNIVIRVLDGDIPKQDWEYIVFDVTTNPPTFWLQGPADLRKGEVMVLSYNLPPGEYKIQIMHKPTMKIIYEEKVLIEG
jgi:hypothetical protein